MTPEPQPGKLPGNCPHCGGSRVRRLRHGPLDYEMFLELGADGPDFELASKEDAGKAWRCADCRHAWGRPDTTRS